MNSEEIAEKSREVCPRGNFPDPGSATHRREELYVKVGWERPIPRLGEICGDLMGNQRGWHWKRRFSGLAFRISFMVFAATLFTSLVITWVSVHSIGTFLHGELDRKFPELLERTSTRLNLWYQQREHDVTAFAGSQILLEGLGTRGDATREEVSWYLSYVLERFPQYSALLLLDEEGELLLRAGEAPELDPSIPASLDDADRTGVSRLRYIQGRRIQLVSAPVENALGERVATLHAVLRIETLEPLLSQPEIAGGSHPPADRRHRHGAGRGLRAPAARGFRRGRR